VTSWCKTLVAWGVGALALISSVAAANERHFAWNYESATLTPGARELELWVTPRLDRDSFYQRADQRLEVELGLAERLQTSVYFNFNLWRTDPDAKVVFTWSISNEWKLKLLDPVADPVGLAVYGEVTGGPADGLLELEAKLILDKQLGPLLLAFNATGEEDFTFGATSTSTLTEVIGTAGATYLFRLGEDTQLGVGAEVRSESFFAGDTGYRGTAFYAGPQVTFAVKGFWAVLSFQPQFAGNKSAAMAASYPDPLELHDHERYQARLLAGIHF